MKTIQKLSGVVVLLCLGASSTLGNVYNLPCIASGNWNSAGIRTSDSYQIGFSTERPNEQADYFEFDLTPLQGQTVTAANLLIIGSTDYNIQSYWATPHPGTNHIQFKVRAAAQCNPAYPITLAQMTTGNNSTTTYINMSDFNRNTDLGYQWVEDGLHTGQRFDCFHYESVGIGEGGKTVGPWLQNEVNAGGKWCAVTYSGYDLNQQGQLPSENYIWGSTAFTSANQFQITTTATGGPIANGTYSLQSVADGNEMDNLGATTNGAPVAQWANGTSNNQKWVVTLISGSTYSIQCVTGGLFLDSLAHTTPGSTVGEWSNSGSNNQRWTITASGTHFKVINVANGLCLDTDGLTANGSTLQMWGSGSSNNQLWDFVAP